MKNMTSIGMFAAVALAIGMVGINFSDGTFALQSNMSPTTYDEGASIYGHLEITQTDSEGNIKSYQQTDNGIVSQGRDCVAAAMFGVAGNNDCTDTTPGGYTFIGLGNTTNLATTTDLDELPTEITDCGLARKAATTITEDQGAITAATNDATAITSLSATFIWDCTANAVRNAGLFNQTTVSNDSVFAMKDFASIVNMAEDDQLTVKWTITIDGSDTMVEP